jgi:pre-mRNA-splicing factor CWC26
VSPPRPTAKFKSSPGAPTRLISKDQSVLGLVLICSTPILDKQSERATTMPLSSKLDYLSKYSSKDTTKKNRSKKKAKKEKTKRDDDDFLPVLPTKDDETDDDDEGLEGDDDKPVIVDPVTSHSEINRPLSPTRSSHRHDTSSSEEEDNRRPRRRHDSPPSSNADDPRERKNLRPADQRQRHDSSSDGDEEEEAAKPARRRHDSSDSDSSVSPARRGQRRQRHDSSSDEEAEGGEPRIVPSKRRRHDSSSSVSEDDHEEHRARMSSGHTAGLQKGRDFAHKEAKIQSQRRDEAQEMVDKYGIGETVYREKTKRAGDKDNDQKTKKKPLTKEEKLFLHTGRAQLEQAARAHQEFAKIQESSFARRSDDTELEDMRKSEIRPDDPMAVYAASRGRKRSGPTTTDGTTSTTITRPVYKGPPPKPNRFHISPGHRWDAVDRGNGFEDRLLAKRAMSHHQREREYRHSAADM